MYVRSAIHKGTSISELFSKLVLRVRKEGIASLRVYVPGGDHLQRVTCYLISWYDGILCVWSHSFVQIISRMGHTQRNN